MIIQWDDNGTADHLWAAVPDPDGYFRLRNAHSGKVLPLPTWDRVRDRAVIIR